VQKVRQHTRCLAYRCDSYLSVPGAVALKLTCIWSPALHVCLLVAVNTMAPAVKHMPVHASCSNCRALLGMPCCA
jgi:hypothetical protein